MDYTRLIKLLRSMETYLVRMSRYVADEPAFEELSDTLTAFQVTVSHYVENPSQISQSGISDLRGLLNDIRAFALRTSALEGEDVHSLKQRLSQDCLALGNQISGLAIGLAINEPEQIDSLVPDQKAAPFLFELIGQRLVLKSQASAVAGSNRLIADAARQALLDQGSLILDDISASNRSPRLRQSFQALQTQLANDGNVIALGLFNRTCGRIISAEIEELPDSLVALLVSQIEGVNTLLAQYPEWRQFVEDSLQAEIDHESLSALIATARSLAEQLRDDRLVASDAVPSALDQVAEWAENPGDGGKREIFSLGRTLENLLSVVLRHIGSFGKDVVKEVRKGAVAVVAAGFLSAAAIGFTYAATQIPGGEWVQGAMSYLKELVTPPIGN